MNTMQIGAAQVAQRGTAPVLYPAGGLERLSATCIEIEDWQIETIKREARSIDPDLLVMKLYPVHNDGQGNLIGAGRCPWCRRIHGHGIGGDSRRVPHCSDDVSPFNENFPKPDYYCVQIVLDVAPQDIRRELRMERSDLLHVAALANSRKRVPRRMWRLGLLALLATGLLEEAINLELGQGRSVKQARRNALAYAWRRRGPGTMRKRLATVLTQAYFAVGRQDER